MVEKAITRVGWIGTGKMGKSMASHILKRGYPLNVYNRTASKADELVAAGATFMQPVEVAKQSDFLFLMLGYPKDVKDVLLDSEAGLLQHMRAGSVVVDCTTSSPALALEIASAAEACGVQAVDAPVSGG